MSGPPQDDRGAGGDSVDDERDPVDELAEEYAVRIRRGEAPLLDEYLELHPEHADELREVLPTVEMIERAKLRRAGRISAAPPPERIGDFRIEREVGRGGMGVVYEAQQESLQRRVALKVLPDPVSGDVARRQRFEREARVAAGLHHTNIVPVFGVGEEDGHAYIVMQFIEGSGLDDVLASVRTGSVPPTTACGPADRAEGAAPKGPAATAESPGAAAPRGRAYWRFVAKVGLQVAEALAYAHERGAFHRDVKPSNLLLDEKGDAWVADFGIAKLADEPELTRSGDVLGTARFLAPEALRGVFDGRSDVYSLGVTLYEMATLSPAFAAAHTAELLDQIRRGAAPAPGARNRDLPRDLDTVIRKAMACEPAHRYASASELADDLRRFLEDRPVRARPVGAMERFTRWCRRNPSVAGLSAVAAASLVVAAVAGWTAYAGKRAALVQESRRLAEVAAAERQARENVQLSLEALEDIFDALAPEDSFGRRRPFEPRPPEGRPGEERAGDGRPVEGRPVEGRPVEGRPAEGRAGPAGGPRFNPGAPGGGPGGRAAERDPTRHAELVESVLGFYEDFAARNDTGIGLRREAARAYKRVADLRRRIGAPDAGAAEWRAIDALQALLRDAPGDVEAAVDLLDAVVRADPERADPSRLSTALEGAVALGREVRDASAEAFADPGLDIVLARALARRAELLESQEHPPPASDVEPGLREAVAILAARVDPDRPDRVVQVELASARHVLAAWLLRHDRATEAETILAKTLADLSPSRAGPDPARHLYVLADLNWTLAEARRRTGDEAGAQEAADRALECERLARQRAFPDRRAPLDGGPQRPG